MMFGREIQLLIDLVFGGEMGPGETSSEYMAHQREHLEGAYRTARENPHGAQKCQKDRACGSSGTLVGLNN